MLQIHGGTTEDDVINCLKDADKEASNINRKLKVDTVVFFDEANTSDVISLIKEIMCDGKCRGIPVPPYLKFVAACNPYRWFVRIYFMLLGYIFVIINNEELAPTCIKFSYIKISKKFVS